MKPLPETVRGATRPEPAAEETPEALFDADVALTAFAGFEV
ncbi:MAG: hypothetical protein ACSLFQ_16260 [Thermoanaerobaculia bacterium]